MSQAKPKNVGHTTDRCLISTANLRHGKKRGDFYCYKMKSFNQNNLMYEKCIWTQVQIN